MERRIGWSKKCKLFVLEFFKVYTAVRIRLSDFFSVTLILKFMYNLCYTNLSLKFRIKNFFRNIRNEADKCKLNI